ncbi:MAG: nucleotidyltransferase family protein [Gammaproteobacteria bacterium]|nr:nucleotidyltransferase family protein [Gammaproteobacteria bacterium]
MKAILLAAGRGERLRPLTDTLPKPLLEVGGKSLIEWHLASLAKAGIADVIINLAWLGDLIRAKLGDGTDYGIRIHYSDEGAQALETGGGIYKALDILSDAPFLAVNADIWTDYPFDGLQLADNDLARLVLVENPSHNPNGDFCLQGGRVGNNNDKMYTFSGIGLYRRQLFDHCESGVFSLTPLLRQAADMNKLGGELYQGEWSDIGTVERLKQLREKFN